MQLEKTKHIRQALRARLRQPLLAATALLLACGAGSVMAQNAAPAVTGPVYVVSYYEVAAAAQPQAQSAPKAIFNHYRQAVIQEPGAVSVEVLSDQGRPNHYTLIEVWNDQDAYSRHNAAPAARQLAADVSPWLAGPRDERVYTKFQ